MFKTFIFKIRFSSKVWGGWSLTAPALAISRNPEPAHPNLEIHGFPSFSSFFE